ncbi:MAG: class I SAM-dependent methyltransferase [Melioribacteraceae bacterium]|nr:class I SAM-dependent methyltransferase [Melioribacteraceae bacterium]
MQHSISDKINSHKYPGLYLRYPVLLRLHHFIESATTLRVWYMKKTLRKILNTLPKKFSLYDAGCGAGVYILPLLSRYPESFFLGVDKIAGNVEVCSEYSRINKLNNARFVQAAIEDFAPTDSMDLIICVTVLQYVENDTKALANFKKNLKYGGKLLLYIPVYYDRVIPFYEKIVTKYFIKNDYDTRQGIKRHYSPEEMFSKLSDSGFTITSSSFVYGIPGKLAYELFSLGLYLFKKLPSLISFILLILFVIAVYPIVFASMMVDYLYKHKKGNGLLIVAEKN